MKSYFSGLGSDDDDGDENDDDGAFMKVIQSDIFYLACREFAFSKCSSLRHSQRFRLRNSEMI